MSFPRWIRTERKARDLTMSECAKRAGVSQPVWSEYEKASNTQPRKPTVLKIAEALGADAYEALRTAGYDTGDMDKADEQLSHLLVGLTDDQKRTVLKAAKSFRDALVGTP